MNLRTFALDHYPHGYSQFGESAMIDHILDVLGIHPAFVVEFGASTGSNLSNTWHLAEEGALALYIESNPVSYDLLEESAKRLPAAATLRETVVDIDPAIEGRTVDVMSIDVDGDDYGIFERMENRPRVLVIEHHPMIPAHVSYVGGPDVGASALALVELGAMKGYALVGTTHCNCLFVQERDASRFDHFDTDLRKIFDPSDVTFAVSNVKSGDYTMLGPWPFGRGEDLTCE